MSSSFRVGHGYDLHRLESCAPQGAGRPLVLAGVAIEHDRGPVAHSDGDAVLHAVTDAILGATGAPDIGQLFPDDDAANEGRASGEFLAAAVAHATDAGWRVVNLDVTAICESPRLAPHRQAMRDSLASLVGCGADVVNVKGKTGEGLGAVGRGEAIEAHALVLMQRVES